MSTDGKYAAWPLPVGTGAMRLVSGTDKALWFTALRLLHRFTPPPEPR